MDSPFPSVIDIRPCCICRFHSVEYKVGAAFSLLLINSVSKATNIVYNGFDLPKVRGAETSSCWSKETHIESRTSQSYWAAKPQKHFMQTKRTTLECLCCGKLQRHAEAPLLHHLLKPRVHSGTTKSGPEEKSPPFPPPLQQQGEKEEQDVPPSA